MSGGARCVRDARDRLFREILIERVALNRSERLIRNSRNCYQLRKSCAEALGRLALALKEQGPIKRPEWEVIRDSCGRKEGVSKKLRKV